jgi:hypothetical protein
MARRRRATVTVTVIADRPVLAVDDIAVTALNTPVELGAR